jgi:hypothetical protein
MFCGALLEPYAYGKAGMQVVMDHQDATHDPLLSWRRTLSAPFQPSLLKGTTFHAIARAVLPCESVHYGISAANQGPVCPPQCIRPVPQSVPSGRRDTCDLAAFDGSGIAPSRLSRVSPAFAPPCPHPETAPAVLNDGSARTNATIVAPVQPPSSTRIRARR